MGNTQATLEPSISTPTVTLPVIDPNVISNCDTIFSEINTSLNRKKHPSVEYVMARPFSKFKVPFIGGLNFNWFSHSAVIYTMPDGTRKVVNIVANKAESIVDTHTPEEYLFTRNSDQGGIFNRNFISIRVYDISDEAIIKMDEKFKEILDRSSKRHAKYAMAFGPMFNFFKTHLPTMNITERGNCARWASVALKEAGLIKRTSMWPKAIFIDMLENCEDTAIKSYANIDIVRYECMYNVKKDYGINERNPIELVSPFQIFRNINYRDLNWLILQSIIRILLQLILS